MYSGDRYVWINALGRAGIIETEMAYGAVVKYIDGGIEFYEMLGEEDYERLWWLTQEEEDVT